jgi:HK97 family phage prohead protease
MPRATLPITIPPGFETKEAALSVKCPDGPEDGGGTLEGLGAAFLNLDATGDIIAPGAFADAIPKFLVDGFIGGLNHDWRNPLGHPAEARETKDGLYIRAVFDDTTDARDMRAKLTPHPETGRATIRKLSIGYKPVEARMLNSPDEIKSYWTKSGYSPSGDDLARADKSKRARLLTKLDLMEISPVSVPANDRANVLAAKMFGGLGMDMPYPAATPGDLAETVDRIRDSLVGIFLDYLCMSLRAIVGNDMVATDDRLGMVGAVFDQTRDAVARYLTMIFAQAETAEGEPAGTTDLGGELSETTGKSASDNALLPIIETLSALSTEIKSRFGLADLPESIALAVPAGAFDEHADAVVSAVEGFVSRADSRTGARFKVGRTLSQANLDEIAAVADAMDGGCRRLRDLIGRAVPSGKAAAPSSSVEAPDLGTDPGTRAGVEPETAPEPARVDPAEVEAFLIAFKAHQTLHAIDAALGS